MLTTILCAAALLGGPLCLPNPNSTGLPARLEVTLAESGDVVDAATEQMQPGNRSLVLYGPLPMNPVPWHQGVLCINPLYLRRGPSSIADELGQTRDTLSLQGMPTGTVFFQTLYRDFGGRAANLSNLDQVGVALGSTNPEPGSGSGGMTTEQESFCGDDASGGAGLYVPPVIACSGKPPFIIDRECLEACIDTYREETQSEQATACECFTDADATRNDLIGEAWATFLLGPCDGDFGDMNCTDALYGAIDAANADYDTAAAACMAAFEAATQYEYVAYAACFSACCQ